MIKIRDLLFFGIIFIFVIIGCKSDIDSDKQENITDTVQNNKTSYDSDLAKKLQADEYGMKKYVMAFLKKGPNRDMDSVKAAEIQRAHLDNINKMAEEGKLVLAGPFLDDGEIRGIYIFNVESLEEAQELTNSDPAIQEGRLVMELHPWYGSASIQEINKWHKKISKENI